MNRIHALSMSLVFAVLIGCTQTVAVKVESEVPEALVSKYPVALGVVYDDAFRNHVFREASEERANWTVESGSSQVEMFQTVAESMFSSVREVGGPPGKGRGIDAVLSPKIEEMQFATPRETGFESYEAWIKYRLKFYEADGQPIADWVVTAYGKASPRFMKSDDEAINEAMIVALRDAGAKISLGFPQVPEVRAWLESRSY
jgi:hypothetical protein